MYILRDSRNIQNSEAVYLIQRDSSMIQLSTESVPCTIMMTIICLSMSKVHNSIAHTNKERMANIGGIEFRWNHPYIIHKLYPCHKDKLNHLSVWFFQL